MVQRTLARLGLPLIMILLAGACQSGAAPRTGSLEVYTSFTCASQLACDSDGFVIALDNASGQRMTAFSDTFYNLKVGQHKLTLSDVQANCVVFGPNPKFVTVEPDTIVQGGFGGTCQ